MNEARINTGADIADEIQLMLNKKARNKNIIMQVVPFAGFIFLFLFFLITTQGKIISASNMSDFVEQCFTITVIAVGATFVYSIGQFDISVGNVMAIGQLIIAKMMIAGGFPVPVIILSGILITTAIMSLTGFITAFLRVPAFIVSLCVMNVCSGILRTEISKNNFYIPYMDYSYFNSPLVKLTALVLIIGIGLIVFNKTRLGRNLKALGENASAAILCGVKARKTYIIGFMCLGLCVGIAAFFGIVRVGVLMGNTGSGVGLDLLVAIVIGGFPLTGGAKSRMIGAIIGALTITLLTNGLAVLEVDPTVALFIKGVLFLTVVLISYERSKGKLVS